ncbi:MAG TPA: FHA domain-containing protein [Polyangiales bacterium]|nr:FHA domain-containing protein [Polyangiales bacterium]
MSRPESNNGVESFELSSLVRLDTELCRDQSTWLLVEVRPFGAALFMSVLRVEHVLVIGRDPACGLVLEGALVSRRHALLRATDTTLEVEDISRHGTLVNGQPLHSARARVEREINLVIGCNRVRLRQLG